ncbi:type II toxin-antitoxin system VapB family antitoxin [Brevundimonas sp.]|uniref:type II toxin-antitoxin system VapB family antitoxin n=1 Tax=Brevundimonas sp. TaxID=1871086 RepID=UPI00391ABC65
MGLSIKRAETERKARAVAERLGVSVTEAIDRALEEKWRGLTAGEEPNETAGRRDALFARIRARNAIGGPSLKEIEAETYGEGGEPI